jgi:DNA primase
LQDLEFRQFVERIKLRSPIEVVVGDRVSGLRQQGALWWARCPFHQERTPSFAVDPRKGTWRCYGACSEGGDALSFVQRFDALSFIEALRLLARQAGEELPERNFARRDGADAALEARFEVLRWAGDFYRKTLAAPEAARARAYLAARGLGEATLAAFGVGWAPAEGSPLVAAAERGKQPLGLLIELGLVRRAQDGRPYDFFRGRIQIPIRDRLGRIVGFGGRVLATDGERQVAKYVNTAETPLFHKGRLIFGLDLAAEEVRKSKHLFLVEGYTDVMAAHQAGLTNTAAVLGTATTADHAALIQRIGARRVTLVFDGDEAGRRASGKALPALLGSPLEVRIASLPEGQDPCDLLVSDQGAREFRERIDAARDWFDWSLERLAGRSGADLSASVEESFQLLERLGNVVERSTRLAQMARALELPEADLRAQWHAYERRARRAAVVPRPELAVARPAPAAPDRMEDAFALLIGALLLDNSLVPVHAALVEQCPAGDLATIFRALLELYENEPSDQPIDAARVMTALGDHPCRDRVVALELRAEGAESPQVLARDLALWISKDRCEDELRALRGELAASVRTFEEDAQRNLLGRLHQKLREGRVRTASPDCSPTAARP